jgi:hypothetical protein
MTKLTEEEYMEMSYIAGFFLVSSTLSAIIFCLINKYLMIIDLFIFNLLGYMFLFYTLSKIKDRGI